MNSPNNNRRAGLSRIQRPSSLLRNIKGRRMQGIDLVEGSSPPNSQPGARNPSASSMSQKKSEKGEDWVKRPPVDSSGSEDERHRRRNADIVPTKLKAQSSSVIPSSGNATKATQSGAASPKPKSLGMKASNEARPASGAKRSAAEISGSHLVDSTGFTRSTNSTKRKKTATTFGKLSQKPASKTTKKATAVENDSPAKTGFKVPKAIDSPSPKKENGRGKNLRDKGDPIASSPTNSPAKKRFTKNLVLDDSPEKPRKGFKQPLFNSTENSLPSKWSTRAAQSGKQASKNGKTPPVEDREKKESSPLRTFKNHFLDDLEDLKDVPEDSSKALLNTQQVEHILDSNDVGLNSDSDLSSLDEAMFPKEPRCPMCHTLVDPDLLKQYTAKGRMNVKNQTAFCRVHKRKEAEDAQKTKGYPKIDWDTLELRFSGHREPLRMILEGEQSSHFADTLKEHIEAGENRTLLRTEDNLTPGYYGPRGLRVMADYIIETFSDTIRRRTIEDHLVSARGYSGYVQAVLVPELAVRLIMDDMSVSEERARQIMSESCDVGELVHEETRDIVRWSDDNVD